MLDRPTFGHKFDVELKVRIDIAPINLSCQGDGETLRVTELNPPEGGSQSHRASYGAEDPTPYALRIRVLPCLALALLQAVTTARVASPREKGGKG